MALLGSEGLLLISRGSTRPLLLRDVDEGRSSGLLLDSFHGQVRVLEDFFKDPVRKLSNGLNCLSGALWGHDVSREGI